MKRDMEALNLRNAFGPMPEACRDALMTAARSVREEEPVKRFTVRTALIAACIILATIAAAIAAGSIFGWNDFFSIFYGDTRVPQAAQEIMASAQEETFTVGPATFKIQERFADRHTAMAGILMLTVWMGIGFNYVLILNAFRGIPEDVIGCARLDGAGPLRMLFSIQLPLISPTLLYVVCTNMIQAMMTSGPVMILTQGGPSRSTTTLIYLMYTAGYRSANYSLAACVSLVAFALTFGFAVMLFWLEGRRVTYQ